MAAVKVNFIDHLNSEEVDCDLNYQNDDSFEVFHNNAVTYLDDCNVLKFTCKVKSTKRLIELPHSNVYSMNNNTKKLFSNYQFRKLLRVSNLSSKGKYPDKLLDVMLWGEPAVDLNDKLELYESSTNESLIILQIKLNKNFLKFSPKPYHHNSCENVDSIQRVLHVNCNDESPTQTDENESSELTFHFHSNTSHVERSRNIEVASAESKTSSYVKRKLRRKRKLVNGEMLNKEKSFSPEPENFRSDLHNINVSLNLSIDDEEFARSPRKIAAGPASNCGESEKCKNAVKKNVIQKPTEDHSTSKAELKGNKVGTENTVIYTSLSNCVVNKIKSKSKYNTWAIVARIARQPSVTKGKSFMAQIYITDPNFKIADPDPTNSSDGKNYDLDFAEFDSFQFSILSPSLTDFPYMAIDNESPGKLSAKNSTFSSFCEVGDVIRIHHMYVEMYNGQVTGRVYNARCITLFKQKSSDEFIPVVGGAPDNVKYTINDFDMVKALKDWWDVFVGNKINDCHINDDDDVMLDVNKGKDGHSTVPESTSEKSKDTNSKKDDGTSQNSSSHMRLRSQKNEIMAEQGSEDDKENQKEVRKITNDKLVFAASSQELLDIDSSMLFTNSSQMSQDESDNTFEFRPNLKFNRDYNSQIRLNPVTSSSFVTCESNVTLDELNDDDDSSSATCQAIED